MRAPSAALVPALLAACVSVAVADAGTQRDIDPAKSKAHFSIQHIFVEKVDGSVPIESGKVVLEPDSAIPREVSAVLDARRIDSGDRDRDASLESDDYFDVKKFPEWTFVSTKIVATGAAAFAMDGMLTIHGVAQPEHLIVTVRGDAAHPAYHATGRIDRHAFGMRGARLDPVIGDAAEVSLDIALRP
jgi:polyisoprenoid-binding protein YceI